MTDIVEKLKLIADAARYADGTDTPLGEQIRSGVYEIERLRDEIELLRQKLEFAEFEWNRATLSWQDAERRAALTSTDSNPTGNIEGGA